MALVGPSTWGSSIHRHRGRWFFIFTVICTGWVVFFIVQSALIKARNVKLHRQFGWFGLALGVAIPILGIATAIAMGRLHMREGRTDVAQVLIFPFFDMVAFSLPFGLAFYWRKKPELHQRLMLIATCSLTAAAFGRLPITWLPHYWGYAGTDALILLGIVRDLLVTKRTHPVYRSGLSLLMLSQTVVIYTFVGSWPVWMRIAHSILAY